MATVTGLAVLQCCGVPAGVPTRESGQRTRELRAHPSLLPQKSRPLLAPRPHAIQVIRSYHGHLSGVYSIALHPNLDVLMTGGRDSVVRVWDMRTKVQAMVLSGHDQTVCSLLAQAPDPQVRAGGGEHSWGRGHRRIQRAWRGSSAQA